MISFQEIFIITIEENMTDIIRLNQAARLYERINAARNNNIRSEINNRLKMDASFSEIKNNNRGIQNATDAPNDV